MVFVLIIVRDIFIRIQYLASYNYVIHRVTHLGQSFAYLLRSRDIYVLLALLKYLYKVIASIMQNPLGI